MSTEGVFRLLANGGADDSMLMATELLNLRIRAIMDRRMAVQMARYRWWLFSQYAVDMLIKDVAWLIGDFLRRTC
jgi:hypothetical protein